MFIQDILKKVYRQNKDSFIVEKYNQGFPIYNHFNYLKTADWIDIYKNIDSKENYLIPTGTGRVSAFFEQLLARKDVREFIDNFFEVENNKTIPRRTLLIDLMEIGFEDFHSAIYGSLKFLNWEKILEIFQKTLKIKQDILQNKKEYEKMQKVANQIFSGGFIYTKFSALYSKEDFLPQFKEELAYLGKDFLKNIKSLEIENYDLAFGKQGDKYYAYPLYAFYIELNSPIDNIKLLIKPFFIKNGKAKFIRDKNTFQLMDNAFVRQNYYDIVKCKSYGEENHDSTNFHFEIKKELNHLFHFSSLVEIEPTQNNFELKNKLVVFNQEKQIVSQYIVNANIFSFQKGKIKMKNNDIDMFEEIKIFKSVIYSKHIVGDKFILLLYLKNNKLFAYHFEIESMRIKNIQFHFCSQKGFDSIKFVYPNRGNLDNLKLSLHFKNSNNLSFICSCILTETVSGGKEDFFFDLFFNDNGEFMFFNKMPYIKSFSIKSQNYENFSIYEELLGEKGIHRKLGLKAYKTFNSKDGLNNDIVLYRYNNKHKCIEEKIDKIGLYGEEFSPYIFFRGKKIVKSNSYTYVYLFNDENHLFEVSENLIFNRNIKQEYFGYKNNTLFGFWNMEDFLAGGMFLGKRNKFQNEEYYLSSIGKIIGRPEKEDL